MSDSIETLNGESVQSTALSNRAFLYGDGVFTTLKLENGKARDAQLHWQRLRSDSRKLKITTPKFEFFNHCLKNTLKRWNSKEGIIRISVYRAGGRGYRGIKNVDGEMSISIHLFTEPVKEIKLQTVSTRLSRNEALAGIKHMNRLEQVLIASELEEDKQEAVVLDTKDFVIEGLMSNIFWFNEDVFYTPSVDYSGVNGLARRKIIQGLNNRNKQLKIDFFYLDVLLKAEFVWLCNAVRGVSEVTKIDDNIFCVDENRTQLLETIFAE